jgi:DNA repair exonuclease SbcCD ATPase subunit
VEQHDRHIAKVYDDMDDQRKEKDADIAELHTRIDTILEKVQDSEKCIMNEIKELKESLASHGENSKTQFEKLNQWKWMLAGGMIVVSWLISHANIDTIIKSIH